MSSQRITLHSVEEVLRTLGIKIMEIRNNTDQPYVVDFTMDASHLLSSDSDNLVFRDVVLQEVKKTQEYLDAEKIVEEYVEQHNSEFFEKYEKDGQIDVSKESPLYANLSSFVLVLKEESDIEGIIKIVLDELSQVLNLQMDLLRKAEILDKDEELVYTDVAYVHFGDRMNSRIGYITITDRRLLINGLFSYVQVGSSPVRRLSYNDAESKPWLHSIDYLDFKSIESAEIHWSWKKKKIDIAYRSEYIEDKSQTVFGPYFFKFQLPTSSSKKEGLLNIEVMLRDLPHSTLSESDFKKKRQEKFLQELRKYATHLQ